MKLKPLFILILLCFLTLDCHKPFDPYKEKYLTGIKNAVLVGFEVKIDNVGSIPELQFFADLILKKLIDRLNYAKSFKMVKLNDIISKEEYQKVGSASTNNSLSSQKFRKLSYNDFKKLAKKYKEHTLINGKYILSNYYIKDRLQLKTNGLLYIAIPSGEIIKVELYSDKNYQQFLASSNFTELVLKSLKDIVMTLTEAKLGANEWAKILSVERKKGKTFLPDPTNDLVKVLEHRINVVRGHEGLNIFEIMKTADWKKSFQWKPFGVSLMFFIICLTISGLLNYWHEKSGKKPFELILIASAIGTLYFFYFMLAALL